MFRPKDISYCHDCLHFVLKSSLTWKVSASRIRRSMLKFCHFHKTSIGMCGFAYRHAAIPMYNSIVQVVKIACLLFIRLCKYGEQSYVGTV